MNRAQWDEDNFAESRGIPHRMYSMLDEGLWSPLEAQNLVESRWFQKQLIWKKQYRTPIDLSMQILKPEYIQAHKKPWRWKKPKPKTLKP